MAIVLDFEMPCMSGPEAAKAIREYEKKIKRNKTPIIGLTGHESSDVKQEAIQAGMDMVKTKPLRKQDILELLKSYGGDQN